MQRKAPIFWYDNSQKSRMTAMSLASISALYAFGHALHQMVIRPKRVDIPVLCVGNLVVGGGGKTPTAMAVMDLVRENGLAKNPCFLSRGYGGRMKGPLRVDPATHSAADIGDEPLLLAAKAGVVIAANRVAGAKFAKDQGFDFIVMDDGLQNPGLHKDFSLVVADGATGFGNMMMLPAGPMRTPLWRGLKYADAILIIGDRTHYSLQTLPTRKPVLSAALVAGAIENLKQPRMAFCGIAHPEKFRRTLESAGIIVTDMMAFPDHHPFTDGDIARIKERGTRPVTTAKDAVRVPKDFIAGKDFDILSVDLQWTGPSREALLSLIKARIKHG